MFRAIGGCLATAWEAAAEVVVAGWEGAGPAPPGPPAAVEAWSSADPEDGFVVVVTTT